eukprot:TRINITY_DN109400_c0_g1_i1.p1 TRINITY_DN109400_c0_g1~~TRINITY_DN109400_c0_g1_i1.p1  ORF type:complete len:421 (-),score=121.11 TRINITY_DN109400_c0_g1_i1:54-1283(-)
MVDALEAQSIESLVAALKEDPSLIYDPKVTFFKEYLQSFGATLPAVGKEKPKTEAAPPAASEEEEEEEEEAEEPEEPEEEDPERLPEDAEPYPEKGPAGEQELSDAQLDKQGELKQAAAEALEDGDLQKALEKYTEAIKIGNVSAMMYAKRAEILLKLKRPCACIADCTSALEINPDSGKAYRVRGKANRRLGRWEAAHEDLSTGQRLDFDDETIDMQKFVEAKFKKIAERKNRQRLRTERIEKKRKEKEIKRRREAAQKAHAEAQQREESSGGGFPGMGGFPGGFPGMPGGMPQMPPGFDPSMLSGLMNDPELMKAFSDPKMAAAMKDIMSNPGNIGKYQSDPDVMNLFQKMMGAFGKAGGGMPGGMPGGFGGMPGGFGGAGGGSASTPGPSFEEVPSGESGDVDEVD